MFFSSYQDPSASRAVGTGLAICFEPEAGKNIRRSGGAAVVPCLGHVVDEKGRHCRP